MRKLLAGILTVLLAASAWAYPFQADEFDSGQMFPATVTTVGAVETLPTPLTYGSVAASTVWGGIRYWQLNVTTADPFGSPFVVALTTVPVTDRA